MSENHSRGGVWHGGIRETCSICTPAKPVAKPVVPLIPLAVVDEKGKIKFESKKKVGA